MGYTREEMEFLKEQGVVKEFPEEGEEDMEFMEFLGCVTGQDDRPETLTLEILQKSLQETLESMYRGILHDLEHIEEATDPGEIMFHAGHAAALQTAMWVLVDDAFPELINNRQRFGKSIGQNYFIVAEEGKITVSEQDIVKEKCQDKLEAVYDALHAIKVDAATGHPIQEQMPAREPVEEECRCAATEDTLAQIMDALAALRIDVDVLMNKQADFDPLYWDIMPEPPGFDGDDGIMEHHFLDEPMRDDRSRCVRPRNDDWGGPDEMCINDLEF